jgi:hypothetical protein
MRIRRPILIGLGAFGLLLLVPLGYIAFLLLVPAIGVFGGSVSPDGKWVAVTEAVQYGPLAVGDEYAAVELRPFNNLFGFLQGKRVFETDIGADDHSNLLGVEWTADKALKIRVRAGSGGGDSFRTHYYRGITIDYESVTTP